MTVVAFLVGLFLGAALGAFGLGLAMAARDGDDFDTHPDWNRSDGS